MPRPVVSRLWIAAAERVLDAELQDPSQERMAEVRSQLRVAATAAEDLLSLVAGPRSAARSATIAALVERFGDHALDVDYMGAAFIKEAVASALVEIAIYPAEADRVSVRCRAAVAEAGAAVDTLIALTTPDSTGERTRRTDGISSSGRGRRPGRSSAEPR